MKQKAVSSHAVYQSVYSYCPNQSIIVSSRHNIQFYQDFAQIVLNSITQQNHYYFAHLMRSGHVVGFGQIPHYSQNKKIRKNNNLFSSHFRHLQIFKSDFMKTNVFWVLKSAQLEFYQTQAPFVFLMLQQIRLKCGHIKQAVATLYDRKYTTVQQQQIKNVQAYAQYSPLINNRLMPYLYNCLQNQAFKKHAIEKIPKNIHQIWLSKNQISNFRLVLHNTIKQKNPNFIIKLWKFQNITKQNVPITYQIVQRIFQYHKTAQKSFYTMAADLLRYELLYNFGGLYVDFKMQGKKPLDNFTKYDIFYLDTDIQNIRFDSPKAIGIGVMGSTQNNYYLKILLNQLISQQNINFGQINIPWVTGGYVARRSFNDEQLFIILGLGYQLLFPLPYDKIVNDCGGENKIFVKDQQIFQIKDIQSGKLIKIGIPCKQYPQAYLISYTPLAKTWLIQKNVTPK